MTDRIGVGRVRGTWRLHREDGVGSGFQVGRKLISRCSKDGHHGVYQSLERYRGDQRDVGRTGVLCSYFHLVNES